MATFFVGQRVRVVRDLLNAPYTVGGEGRITQVDATNHLLARLGFKIMIDSFPAVYSHPDELEPIQPSGHRAGDYSLSELLDRCRAGEGVAA